MLPPESAEVLSHLVERSAAVDARASGLLLGNLLRHVSGLDRTWLVGGWATSPSVNVRLALAHALEMPVRIVGGPTALEHLVEDPDPSVRAAARRAVEALRLRARIDG